MKKLEHKDPMALDLLAARTDRAHIFFNYGRTDSIAFKRGGKFNVECRARHMKRVVDVLRECDALDKPVPPHKGPPLFHLTFPQIKK